MDEVDTSVTIEIRHGKKYSKVELIDERYLRALVDDDPSVLYPVFDKQVWALHKHFELDKKKAGN